MESLIVAVGTIAFLVLAFYGMRVGLSGLRP